MVKKTLKDEIGLKNLPKDYVDDSGSYDYYKQDYEQSDIEGDIDDGPPDFTGFPWLWVIGAAIVIGGFLLLW